MDLLRKGVLLLVVLVVVLVVNAVAEEAPGRPRIRDLGVVPGVLAPGPNNAITDVVGVKVGHRTLIEGEATRTGSYPCRPETAC